MDKTDERRFIEEEEEDDDNKMDIDQVKPPSQLSFMDEIMYYLPENDYDCHVREAQYKGDRIYSVIHERIWEESDAKEYNLESYERQPDAIFTFLNGMVLYRRICTNPRKLFYNTGPNITLEVLVPADTIIPNDWQLLNPGNHTINYPINNGKHFIQVNYGKDYMIIQAKRKNTTN